ncbi:MAG: hypothetical protein J3R72DRAFT_524893 [Linnemannia gamsii]|nr:MAG: hypothetical protein J3R72DRAFT_524893 [Linnemannia gamsii]
MAQRSMWNYSRHRGQHGDVTQHIQAFQAVGVPADTRWLQTYLRPSDPIRTVRRTFIQVLYPEYERIEYLGPPVIPNLRDIRPPLIPRRIQAYPGHILMVHLPQNDADTTSRPVASPALDDQGDGADSGEDDGGGGQGAAGGEPPNYPGGNQGDNQDDEMDDMPDGVIEYGPDGYYMDALKLSPLNYPPARFAEHRSSRSPHFFALPVGKSSIEQCSWKVFRVCTCTSSPPATGRWNPHLIHEQSYEIVETALAPRFIDVFGPLLVSKANAFLTALRMPMDPSEVNPAPMSDFDRTISHLRRELELATNDEVVAHLQKTINDLNGRFPGGLPKRQRVTRSDLLLFSSFTNVREAIAMETDDSQDGHLGAYPTASHFGHERFVCYHHYKQLHPDIVQDHVQERTGGTAEYNIHTGKFSTTITSEDALTRLCSVESAKVGFVSEFDATLEATDTWGASMEDIRRLHAFAASLGIKTMTVSGKSSGEGEGEETNHVRALLRDTIAELTKVNVICESKVDVSAILQDVSGARQAPLCLSIKDNSQEVSSEIFSRHLGVRHAKIALESVPLASEGHFFLAGKMQSLEIPSDGSWSSEIQGKISQVLTENTALTSLTLDCKSRGFDFKSVVDAINEIRETLNKPDPQNPPPRRLPFRHVILKDRTDNDATAWFDLTQPTPEDYTYSLPIALDVTSRFPPMTPSESSTTASSGGSMASNQTVSSLLKAYGSVVRVLHLIGPTPSCLSLMGDLLGLATDPVNLVSLTLRLDHLRESHVDDLLEILSSSKNTFKQLALVGRPQDNGEDKAATNLLKALGALDETVKGVQVLATRTKVGGIDDWIAEVERVTKETSSTLVVVESAKEFGEIVPSLTEKGLATLEAIFTSSEPVSVVKDEHMAVEIGDPAKY